MMASRHGFAAVVVSVIVCISLVLSAFFCAFPWSMTAPAVAEAASASSSSSSGDTRAEVQAFVKTYIDAANKADVTTMMEMFSRKSGVTSIGDGDISRGWDDIRTDYDQMIGKEGSYKISVGSIDVMPLGSSYALVVAPYTMTVATGQTSLQVPGAMTLVVEKAAGKWLIVHEHDSTKSIDPGEQEGDEEGD